MRTETYILNNDKNVSWIKSEGEKLSKGESVLRFALIVRTFNSLASAFTSINSYLKCSKQDGFFPADPVFLASTNLMVFAILRLQTWMKTCDYLTPDVKYILVQHAKKQSYGDPNKGEKRQKEKEKIEKKREKTKKENMLERMMKMEARLECLTIELLQVKY
ncbi:hypothetical protein QVD17_29015 [Tagetes erecta]|uniref:Uncharacterized protein n=1 Tax=Tagetes erecta TaxID=13708 RepID=A0AAD8KFX4_TARER|nr:hypothetical protein QVD17_29015 [Tagetes erecta]